MRIGGFQKFTLVDYPGKLACTLFFSGCSFRCPWCYNPELVIPERIREHPSVLERNVMDFLEKRKDHLEGVVLTGGEPTIDPEILPFCERLKQMGYRVKLDTNGSHPGLLKKLVKNGLVDYVAMDVKAPPDKYGEAAGLNRIFSGFGKKRKEFWKKKVVRNVEDSMEFLKRGRVEFEFRTTLVPGVLGKGEVMEIARWISPAPRYILQEFKPYQEMEYRFEIVSYSDKYLTGLLKAVSPFFEECELRRC